MQDTERKPVTSRTAMQANSTMPAEIVLILPSPLY
jgi:hypothetical protein